MAPTLAKLLPNKVGIDIRRDARLNKGSGFSKSERDRLHLRELFVRKIFTVDENMGCKSRHPALIRAHVDAPDQIYLSLDGAREE
jgi:hypothetical protein